MSQYLQSLFNGGQVDPGVNGANLDPRVLTNPGAGFSSTRRKLAAKGRVQLAEAAGLWVKFLKGDMDPFLMKEALSGPRDWTFPELARLAPSIFNETMTRDDFTNLSTYVQDRIMYDEYAAFPKTYEQVCNINRSVKDFRAVERWVSEGGETPFQKVGELAGFNREKFATDKYTYQVYKYEKGMSMSWESVINDDMNMFKSVPSRIAAGAIRTIEQYWLQLIAGTTGPNTSFYGSSIALKPSGTINNTINLSSYTTGTFTGTANNVLNALSLILATGLLMNQATAEGRPIDPGADELIVLVGDGVLFQTVNQIVSADMMQATVLGGVKATSAVTSDLVLMSKNWIRGKVRPVYAPELRNICTSNLATSWWLFAKPGASRPAVELGFMPGFDSPQLYKKASNTQRVSGGIVEEHGDFETMATEYKGLIVFGGTRMDPRMTMASNGTGS